MTTRQKVEEGVSTGLSFLFWGATGSVEPRPIHHAPSPCLPYLGRTCFVIAASYLAPNPFNRNKLSVSNVFSVASHQVFGPADQPPLS